MARDICVLHSRHLTFERNGNLASEFAIQTGPDENVR